MGSTTSTHEPLDHKNAQNASSNFKRHASCRGTKIETIAFMWAMQCREGHDACRSTPTYKHCGQNLGLRSSRKQFQEPNPLFFRSWTDDEIGLIKDPPSMVDAYQPGQWGNFTEVVWADTIEVGCGKVGTLKNVYEKTVILVCNYCPGGNLEGGKMYITGEPASKCPEGTGPSQKYPNLCASLPIQVEPEFITCFISSASALQRDILVIIVVRLFLN